MRRDEGNYKPHGKSRAILDRAMELIQAVPYKVSTRWIFYRLLQEGYYASKGDYQKLISITRDARHSFYGEWKPDTLADDTRGAIIRGRGHDTERQWLDTLAKTIQCTLDYWNNQDYYVELWFEARAMAQQFAYYTEHITLRPMGGHASIAFKWEIAKDLENAWEWYGKPIRILYFGDLDPAGGTIMEVVEEDVRKWCGVDFDLIRCGLTMQQVRQYQVPENFEKPGEYQWEALSDIGAREIIESSVNPFINADWFSEIERKQKLVTDWIRPQLTTIAKSWKD